MLYVKPGVQFDLIAPAGFVLLKAIQQASELLLTDLTITSATDGIHTGPTDPHLRGEAYDVRTKDLTDQVKAKLEQLVAAIAGPQFYVLLEDEGGANEHLHCQVRKGLTYTDPATRARV